MTATMSKSPEAAETGTLALAGRVVLLATDGSEGAIAGAHVALALARAHGAEVHVINVVDTRGAPIPPPLDIAIGLADGLTGPDIHMQQAADIRAALGAALGTEVTWPVRIALGTPAHAIAREAKQCGAALVVTGLRRHGRMDRALEDETTLNLMRSATCPVLGVVSGTTTLPSRVLAAVDFSKASLTAVRTAAGVTEGNPSLILAYVPPVTSTLSDDGEAFIHELGVEAGFARIADDFRGEGIKFDHVVLHHAEPRPAAELLLEYADIVDCDLIAAGAARHGRIERWMLGSVSTDLVREGRRSVLVVPVH